MLHPGETVLGRYVIEALIGQGGMGQVYSARHARLGHLVAIKILHQVRPNAAARFEREAELMARVRHPNVVALLDYGILDDGRPCIAMEHVAGELLDTRLQARRALPWTEATDLLVGILDGLDAIHAQSVLHRDLKPGNVLLIPNEGGHSRPKLLDFGIAKAVDDESRGLTRAGSFVGTPAYASPEQLLGQPLEARSDVYSAATIFYELVTGTLPFPHDTLAALLERTQRYPSTAVAPPGMPALPKGVLDALHPALSPRPKDRPASARLFARQLRDVRRTLAAAARPSNGAAPRTRPPSSPQSQALTPPQPYPFVSPAHTQPRAPRGAPPHATLSYGGGAAALAPTRPSEHGTRRRLQPSQRHDVIGHHAGREGDGNVILVVEDDPDVRQQLLEVLTDERFRVVAVDDGAPALAWLYREPRPALILTDWWMPRMDGGALLDELRQNQALSDIPVIVITADPNVARKTDPRLLAGILRKPLAVQELVDVVSRFVSPAVPA